MKMVKENGLICKRLDLSMTKEEALEMTQKKFTNLFDGDILPRVSVGKIISYYESLIAGNKPVVTDRDCNITRAFHEAETYEQMKDFIDEHYDHE
jgi:hypothetical protein